MTNQLYFIANWKMNMTISSTKEYINICKNFNSENSELVICPPYPLISLFNDAALNNISYGAQNCYLQDSGAFTGEVNVALLKDFGCEYVIVGHSERRAIFAETNNEVRKKITKILENDLVPVLCVGETFDERKSGNYKDVINEQIENSLPGKDELSDKKIIIAYEPVWSIGTGVIPSVEEIEEVIAIINNKLQELGIDNEQKTPILYGGSVSEKNYKELLAAKGIGGFLVGSASLNAQSFCNMAPN